MIYSKERFCAAIESIRRANAFLRAVNKAGSARNFSNGYHVDFFPEMCDEELCYALQAMFDDKYETIVWFCSEINYGEDYPAGGNNVDGKEWPLRNAEELYDYLVYMMKNDSR